ncbi:MAG: hypothetical protein LIR50_15005 [Bacillota bacterium]|nr:hypothetical protein [Bacillota bacterium]
MFSYLFNSIHLWYKAHIAIYVLYTDIVPWFALIFSLLFFSCMITEDNVNKVTGKNNCIKRFVRKK